MREAAPAADLAGPDHRRICLNREENDDEATGIAEALREAIAEEMERDRRVFCIGEDIGVPGGWGGAFTVTLGLERSFPIA